MGIKISIITVSLNAVAYIETALQSVHAQTYPCLEHVVIDGGSTDGTLEVVDQYRDRLAYFMSEPDRGIYHAMNKGIKIATGDVLFFLNADDRFADRQVVADVVSVFSQNADLEIVYGNLLREFSGNIVQRKQPSTITREYLAGRTILHQTVFARREVFDTTSGFSEHYRVVSDYEWALKVFLRDRRNYLYYDRDIAVMDTRGRSWTTKWENERLRVMMKYFGPYEIFKCRVWPRQKNSLESSLGTALHRLANFVKREI